MSVTTSSKSNEHPSPSNHQSPAPLEAGQENAHNVFDSKDNRNLDVRAAAWEKHEKEKDQAQASKTVENPLEPAQKQGHEPSRGAKIDAEIQKDEEELLRKKEMRMS